MSDIKDYERLANAIIRQAVKDWKAAVRTLKRLPRSDKAKQVREDCESFFLSDWFTALTDVDGAVVLQKLKEEARVL